MSEIVEGAARHKLQLEAHKYWSAAKTAREAGDYELAKQLKAEGNRIAAPLHRKTPERIAAMRKAAAGWPD